MSAFVAYVALLLMLAGVVNQLLTALDGPSHDLHDRFRYISDRRSLKAATVMLAVLVAINNPDRHLALGFADPALRGSYPDDSRRGSCLDDSMAAMASCLSLVLRLGTRPQAGGRKGAMVHRPWCSQERYLRRGASPLPGAL